MCVCVCVCMCKGFISTRLLKNPLINSLCPWLVNLAWPKYRSDRKYLSGVDSVAERTQVYASHIPPPGISEGSSKTLSGFTHLLQRLFIHSLKMNPLSPPWYPIFRYVILRVPWFLAEGTEPEVDNLVFQCFTTYISLQGQSFQIQVH